MNLPENDSSSQGRLLDNDNDIFNIIDYDVDMVFVIDATGSMEEIGEGQKRLINIVKENAKSFYSDCIEEMKAKHKQITNLRVRIIVFRDYIADREAAMLVTDFFNLPTQSKAFEDCIASISAMGGGDIPEDGLEALAYAMKSNWATRGKRNRRIIVVWTDAETHPLGFGAHTLNYPKGMPSNFEELSNWWYEMPAQSKRLILFTPDEPWWSYIAENWDNVIHFPSVAGEGLAEHSYSDILNVIANSV